MVRLVSWVNREKKKKRERDRDITNKTRNERKNNAE
jgi:hypothetical protein